MLIRTARPSNDVRQMLDHACARQAFAELRAAGAAEDAEGLRIRFDQLEEDGLHLLVTPSVDPARAPTQGESVAVQLVTDGHSCEFHSVVRRVVSVMGSGARSRAAGLILSVPDRIVKRHRRSAYRVPVAARDAIDVSICQATPPYGDCSPVNARHSRGRMVNLSAGGVCAIIHVERPSDFQEGEPVFIEFKLPGADEEFILLCEVRHVRSVRDGGGVLVGLRFQSGVSWPVEPMTQAISQFVTREERRRLRRRR